jgi:hypothetical protein
MFYIRINFNTINYLRDKVFFKDKAFFLLLKELRYKDKVKETYY